MFVLKNYHMVRLLFNCTIQSPNGSGTQGDHAKEPVAGSDADGNTGVVASSAESVESASSDGALAAAAAAAAAACAAAAAATAVVGLAFSGRVSGTDAGSIVIEIPRPSALKAAALVCCGIGAFRWLLDPKTTKTCFY